MKRTLIAIVVVLLLALGLGTLLLSDGGYVLVHFSGWELETSLVFALLVLLALAAALTVVLLLLQPFAYALNPKYWASRRTRKAHSSHLRSGFTALSEGKWEKADRQFLKSSESSIWPLPSMIGAAIAARQKGDMAEHYAWLELAQRETKGDTIPLLAHAYFALLDGTPLKAKTLLEPQQKKLKKNPWFLTLLAEAYFQDEDWHAYTELAPQLKVNNAGRQVSERESFAWAERLRIAAGTIAKEKEDVRNLVRAEWHHMPSHLRNDMQLIIQYTGYLVQLDGGKEAFKIVRDAMMNNWTEALLPVIAGINKHQVPITKRIELLESWLQQRPDNQAILLCLAQVASGEPSYLHSVEEWLLQCQDDPRARRALAECYRAQGLQEKANAALWQWQDSMPSVLDIQSEEQALVEASYEEHNQTRPSATTES